MVLFFETHNGLDRTTVQSVTGQSVGYGDLVGYCGTTGNNTGIHLHLGIQLISTGAYVDPEMYFRTYVGPIPTGLSVHLSRETRANGRLR